MPPPKIGNTQELSAFVAQLELQRDNLIDQYEEAIQAVKKIVEIAHLLKPSLIEHTVWELTRELPASDVVPEETQEAQPELPPKYTGTVYERMVQFFVEHDNLPASNAQIREAINSTRGTVAMVLYNTHPESFEKVKREGDHIVYWCLSDDEYSEHCPQTAVLNDRPVKDEIPF